MPPPDTAWLDRMYNNRALVPDHPAIFSRWVRDAVAARAALQCRIDVPYGDGPDETLDVFPAAGQASNPGRAPVLVFIHGGYWRSLDKSDHSFIAAPFVDEGVCVVVPNYALCPGTAGHPVTIPVIALQMVRALAWTARHVAQHGGDATRITVVGHSAGGHLAAMLLACAWPAVAGDLPVSLVRQAVSLSGLFELEPLRHAPFLQTALGLTADDARRASPALWPAPEARRLHALVGGDESAEFIRQNDSIRRAWGAGVVPTCEALPGLNHFTIVDALADPAHALHRRVLGWVRAG